MLDHMMFSHELSEGGKTTNSYRNEAWNGSSPNDHYDESRDDGSAENGEETRGDSDEKSGGSDDDGGGGGALAIARDSAADDESVDAADENIVVIETVECEPNIEEITINAPPTPRKKDGSDETTKADDDDRVKTEGRIIVVFGEPAAGNGKTAKVSDHHNRNRPS